MKKLLLILLGTVTMNSAFAQCANFTVSQSPICTGDNETFTDLSSGGAAPFTYSWNFGANAVPATSALQNPPVVTYTQPGVKIVTLHYTSSGFFGCNSTYTATVTVNANPIATFTSTAPQCVGNGVNFTNTGSSGPGVTYSWNFGSNATPSTSSAENPTGVTFSASGPQLITFSVNNGFCTTVDTMTIHIASTPTASFASNAPACMRGPVNFTNTGSVGAGLTYLWNFGVAAVPATSVLANPPPVSYTSPGVKTITFAITNSVTGCTSVTTQQITIYQDPVASFTSNAPQCTGNNVNFTNTGTNGPGITYSWSFGADATPATSNTENPSGVTYSTPGPKLITFTIDNGYCTATDTLTIHINQSPTASFTSTAPQCAGAPVNFTNTGTPPPGITYLWNFGPGANPATSNVENPAGVTFSIPGSQAVSLTITEVATGCASTVIQYININPSPTASFTSNAPQCAGNQVNFTNTGSAGPGVTYNWSFGANANPQNSGAESPSGIVYSAPGPKLVTFSVSEGSCTSVDTATIIMDTTPVASFTSTAPQCQGQSVSFTNTGTMSGVTYSWNFGPNGNPAVSNAQNPSGIKFTASGIQNITLTVTDPVSGCSSTITQYININPSPVATFFSNTPVCAGTAADFTNTGSSGANLTYSWDFGSNSTPQTSSSESPTGITYSSGGMKLVTFTISDGVCSSTDTVSVAIDSVPVLSAGKDTTICATDSVQIGGTPVAGYKYSWFPSSVVSNPNIANPEAKPIAPVTTYIVTATSPAGCMASDTVIVTMLAPLVSNAGQPESICRNDSVQLGAMPVNGQKYNWSPGKGLSDSTIASPYAMPDSSLTYTLTVSGWGCTPARSMVTVTVNQLPLLIPLQEDTIAGGQQIQLEATQGGAEYSWLPVAGLSNSNIYNPVASPDTTTKYVVWITDVQGCVNRDTIVVNVLKSNFWAPTAFTPNGDGRDDIFYIHGQFQTFDFGVYNRWGEQIFHTNNLTQGWDGTRQTDGEKMPDGAYIYYVKGTLNDGSAVSQQGMVNLIR